jgi:tungstate transport system ATP-binding protein
VRLAYQLNDLVFSYGPCPVICIDHLEIPAGEIVALVGPNGSGKTTLLHLLAFIERPTSGSIRLLDHAPEGTGLLAFRRRVGLLLQNPYLFHTTVLANLTWGLKIRGVPPKKAREDALDALALVGLQGFESRYARSLSGGETQRVALARALALTPEVLLLDEPANHLDRESVQRTEALVTTLNRERGTTVILTTHHLAAVQSLPHRVLHMVQGNVVTASPDNLFRGRLDDDGNVFETEKIRIRLPVPLRCGTLLTIDPAKIDLLFFRTDISLPNTFPGSVRSLSLENGRIEVLVDAGEVFHVVVDPDRTHASELRLGQPVFVHISAESIKVF